MNLKELKAMYPKRGDKFIIDGREMTVYASPVSYRWWVSNYVILSYDGPRGRWRLIWPLAFLPWYGECAYRKNRITNG